MPEPHDFAVRTYAVRLRALRSLTGEPALRSDLRANAAASIASHPAFVTTRDPPLVWGETGRADRGDLPDGTSEIFLWTGTGRPKSGWNR
jgi:hypothetical protein